MQWHGTFIYKKSSQNITTWKISSIRKEYTLKSLDIKELNPDSHTQFKISASRALASEVLEVKCETLSYYRNGMAFAKWEGIVYIGMEVDHGFVFFYKLSKWKRKRNLTFQEKASFKTFFGRIGAPKWE